MENRSEPVRRQKYSWRKRKESPDVPTSSQSINNRQTEYKKNKNITSLFTIDKNNAVQSEHLLFLLSSS